MIVWNGIAHVIDRPWFHVRYADSVGGLDHGVGHFRPLSLTRQRHWLACLIPL